MLYGYGGFSVSLMPAYRPDVPAWLDLGGIWVTANLRGGAEYGEAWHQAGMLEKKQNVFDDFIAVAEYLDRGAIHFAIALGDDGGLKRRIAGRCRHGTASRSLRRGGAGRRCDGHAALRPVHRRAGLGHRVRIGRRPAAVLGAASSIRRCTIWCLAPAIPRRS